jgi:peptidoglycan hydrolase-like protein with peptidoglycan-binding domain
MCARPAGGEVTDTQWADVSQWQRPVDDAYPWQFFCFRSNDGDIHDSNFAANRAWADKAVADGRIFGYLVYYFYRPGLNGAAVLKSMVGTPNGRMAVMIDVESDAGRVAGNQSAAINAQFDELARWLGSPKRVTGYGNVGDLDTLWPSKPQGVRLVIAAYGSNPAYPGKFAHQYSDSYVTPPFGACDINSAGGMSAADLERMFGFTASAPKPPPKAPQQAWPYGPHDYLGVPSPDPHCHSGYYGGKDAQVVLTWQHQMSHRGWVISHDGMYGPQSRSVCTQFQAEKGLKADGLCGPRTWEASWTAPVT